jgi:molybdate transport system substrate-binding protein
MTARLPLRRARRMERRMLGMFTDKLRLPVPLLAVFCVGLSQFGCQPASNPLTIHCAVSNKSVLEVICADYAKEYGTAPHVQYGPSQTLLTSIEISHMGDLYLPADDSYLDVADSKQLIAKRFPLAVMEAVIAVPKGNPKKLTAFVDLLREDVRLAQANPEASAIGKLTKQALAEYGQWDKLHARTAVYMTTIAEVANSVKVGSVDAGIVYDAILHDYPSLEAVTIPELAPAKAQVAVAVLSTSKQQQQALHLARYLSAGDKGLVKYREFGFKTASGEPWRE